MKKINKKYLILTIVLLSIITCIGFVCIKNRKQIEEKQYEIVTTPNFNEDDIKPSKTKDGWLTYTNDEFGYEVSFPENWSAHRRDSSFRNGTKAFMPDYENLRLNMFYIEPYIKNMTYKENLKIKLDKYNYTFARSGVEVYQNTPEIKSQIIENIESKSLRNIDKGPRFIYQSVKNVFDTIKLDLSFATGISSDTHLMPQSGKSLFRFIENKEFIFVLTYNIVFAPRESEEEKYILLRQKDELILDTVIKPELQGIAESFKLKQ